MQTQKRYRLDKPEHTEFRIYHTALRRAFRRNEGKLSEVGVCLARYAKANLKSVLA